MTSSPIVKITKRESVCVRQRLREGRERERERERERKREGEGREQRKGDASLTNVRREGKVWPRRGSL